MKKAIGIIPARYASSRFPGKPLAIIWGASLIQRVYEQAVKSKLLDKVVIATDDQRIYDHVLTFTNNVVLTNTNHKNGTSRCFEALEKQEEQYDILINIQGDEPFIEPNEIDQLVTILQAVDVDISTLVSPNNSRKFIENNNFVKVTFDENNNAILFSRKPITVSGTWYKHIGIYGFKASIIPNIKQLSPTPNEELEKLEQLRWLDHGYTIKVGLAEHSPIAIDIPEDIDTAEMHLDYINIP